MVGAAEERLLQAVIRNDCHVLRGLFPPIVQRRYNNLRPRCYDFELPAKDVKNFIPRVLYKRLPYDLRLTSFLCLSYYDVIYLTHFYCNWLRSDNLSENKTNIYLSWINSSLHKHDRN